MYHIDLRLPIACPECGYRCCANHFKTCYKPIFSGEFCLRNANKIDEDDNGICERYPLGFSIEEVFYIIECFGSEFIPDELYLVKDLLNKLHPFKEFHYKSESIILHITGSGKNEQSFYGLDKEPLHVVLARASQKLIKH